MRTFSLVRTAAFVAALAAPALVAGAQTTPATQPVQPVQTVRPKHHSLLKGALVGGAAGSAIPGHRHPVLGALAGAEVQHRRNKADKKAYKQAQAQQAAPMNP